MRCDWVVLARIFHQDHGSSGVEICVNAATIPDSQQAQVNDLRRRVTLRNQQRLVNKCFIIRF